MSAKSKTSDRTSAANGSTESVFDRKDPHPERNVKSDPTQKRLNEELDEALEETFPASDPAAISQPASER